MTEEKTEEGSRLFSDSVLHATKFVCGGIIVASLLSCLVLAAMRSTGLVEVRVTALDAAAEPKDHDIPLFKQKEALPDYEVVVRTKRDQSIDLGTKIDTSAVDGLTWKLADPVSTAEIAGIRLQDQDKLASDVLTEVQIDGPEVVSGNYRFEFRTEQSFRIGIESFFQTPIGMAISGAFFVAILVMLLRHLA